MVSLLRKVPCVPCLSPGEAALPIGRLPLVPAVGLALFVQDEQTVGIFVGLWVPSIYSFGALLLAPVGSTAPLERTGARR